MLRTTITKIKRVCTIAFLPRFLRGNLRYSPSNYATFGKFEKPSSAVQKSVWKSTRATDDFNQTPKKSTNHGVSDLSEESFWKPLSHDENLKVCITNRNVVCALSEMPRKSTRSTSPSFREVSTCCCHESNRVIAAIFGEDPASNSLKADVLGNIAHFTMYDNQDSEKLISDNRIQLGTLSSYDSKNIEHADDSLTKDNYRSVLCYEVVLVEGKQEKEKEIALTPLQEKIPPEPAPLYNDLCDVDPYEHLTESNIKPGASTALSAAEEGIDAYWTDVYEAVVEKTNVFYEPNQAIDENTLKTYRVLKAKDANYKDTIEGSKQMKHTPEELYKMVHSSPYDDDLFDEGSSDFKLHEAKIAQKINHIEGAPILVGKTSKVEGFNVTPKVLENIKTPVNVQSSTLDEVANRCLNLPSCKVDEMLVKEMEKLGVEKTHFDRAFGGSKLARELQLMKITELEAHKVKENPTSISTKQEEIELSPSSLQGENQNLRELNETKLNISNDPVKVDEITNLNLNVDQKATQAPAISEPVHKKPHINLTAEIWGDDHLDPKHVLTCNETCPINPKPIFVATERPIEDAEAIFDHNTIVERDKLLGGIANDIKQSPVAPAKNYATRNEYITGLKTSQKPNKTATGFNLEAATATITAEKPIIKEDTAKAIQKEPQPIQLNTAVTQVDPAIATKPIEQSKTEDSPKPTGLTVVDTTPTYIKTYTIHPNWDGTTLDEAARDTNKDLVKCIKATSDQLQVTSDKIHATSEKLHVTSEQLQATTEKLQATTNVLQSASIKPDTQTKQHPGNKGETLNHSILKPLLANPVTDSSFTPSDDAFVDNYFDDDPSVVTPVPKGATLGGITATETTQEHVVQPLLAKPVPYPSFTPIDNATIDAYFDPNPSVTTSVPRGATLNGTTATDTSEEHVLQASAPKTKEISEDIKPTVADSPKVDHMVGLSHSEPATDNIAKPLELLPELTDKMKLSDLLKLVRERNRLITSSNVLENTLPVLKTPPSEVEAKKKSIPPLSQPRHVAPVFKTPEIPPVKNRPKVCTKSRRKKDPSKTNCTQCDLEILGLNDNLEPRSNCTVEDVLSRSGSIYQHESQSIAMEDLPPSASLTEEIILQLQHMGDVLSYAYQRGKMEALEEVMLAKTRHQARLFKAKDYEPWLPIPSWPHASKKPNPCERQKLQCPSDGCKAGPPKSDQGSLAGLKPCDSYPTFPKRSFSVLVSLGAHKVVDLGEF